MNNKRRKDYDADNDDSDSAPSVDSAGKRKSFRRLIVRFAEKTSMQGVPYINNAKLLGAKIIWSVLLLIALVALGIHLWYLFTQFYGWPKQTKVELGFANLRFPDVTICNTNPIHKGRLDQETDVKQLKQLISDLNPRNLVPDQFDDSYNPLDDTNTNNNNNNQPPPNSTAQMPNNGPSTPQIPDNQATTPKLVRKKRFVDQYDNLNLTTYNENFQDNSNNDMNLGENEYDGAVSSSSEIQEVFEELYMDLPKHQRAELGHQINDMLLSCTFNGRQCDSKLFRLHQTSNYGNCWILNSNKFTVQNSGPSGGLSMILYLEVQEYLKGLTTGYGLRLQIHEPRTIPYPAEEGHFIPSSMETDIGIKMTYIDRISGNYGDCDDGITFNGAYGRKYTRRACQRICEMEAVISQCECFADVHEEIALIRSNGTRPCRSNREKRCEEVEIRKFNMKETSCPCPNPCVEIQYQKFTSSRQWPNDDYARVLLQSICSTNKQVCATLRNDINDQRIINNNFLKLNIYYEDLNFQNITEEPEIALAQFLSDVGGAVGLWIGLSILSLCEIIQLLVEICDYFAHRTIKRRRREKRRASRRLQANSSNHPTNQSKDSDKHSNHKNGLDRPPAKDSPRSSPRYLDIDLGKPFGRHSPRFDRRVNNLKDMRGYDSDNSKHGSSGSGDKRSHGDNFGRGLRYDDDYFARNYMMGY